MSARPTVSKDARFAGEAEGHSMHAITVYVPRDSAALAVGADEVVAAIEREATARGLTVRLVRNGSRGMLWLETLVEVQTSQGRRWPTTKPTAACWACAARSPCRPPRWCSR